MQGPEFIIPRETGSSHLFLPPHVLCARQVSYSFVSPPRSMAMRRNSSRSSTRRRWDPGGSRSFSDPCRSLKRLPPGSTSSNVKVQTWPCLAALLNFQARLAGFETSHRYRSYTMKMVPIRFHHPHSAPFWRAHSRSRQPSRKAAQ